MNKKQQGFAPSTPEESRDALGSLAPKSKAGQFRLLLPAIEAKIREGVGHAAIIRALQEQGLEFTEGTYFNYLQRYRTGVAMAPARRAAPQGGVSGTARTSTPPASPDPSGNAGRRPPTFDYDPRGIPDLLK
jgi:hypothetical protein